MDVDQYKNTSLSQLYHPPRTPFSQNTNHWLLLPCEYCKVFKNNFFIESFQKQPFADIPQNRYSLKFRKLHRKALCWGLILKNLQVEGLPLHKKTLPQVFSCELWEIFKNTIFLQNTSSDCFCTSGGCFYMSLKYHLTAISQPGYDVLIIFSSRHLVSCIKSRIRLFINFLSSVRFSK